MTDHSADPVRWTDVDMAQAYLAGYNAAHAINVPPLDPWQGELEDIAEDFGFWLSEVYDEGDLGDQHHPGKVVGSMADTVRVTLWFDTPLEDVQRHLGDDFKPEAGEGITVEAMAAALVRNHHAKYGYIGWRVQLIDGLACSDE